MRASKPVTPPEVPDSMTAALGVMQVPARTEVAETPESGAQALVHAIRVLSNYDRIQRPPAISEEARMKAISALAVVLDQWLDGAKEQEGNPFPPSGVESMRRRFDRLKDFRAASGHGGRT